MEKNNAFNYDPYGDLTEIQKEQQEKLQHEEEELNKLFYRAFSTSDGKKVLEYFAKNTIDKPCFVPGVQDSSAYGFYRDGQNSIIREIKIRLERSQQ